MFVSLPTLQHTPISPNFHLRGVDEDTARGILSNVTLCATTIWTYHKRTNYIIYPTLQLRWSRILTYHKYYRDAWLIKCTSTVKDLIFLLFVPPYTW